MIDGARRGVVTCALCKDVRGHRVTRGQRDQVVDGRLVISSRLHDIKYKKHIYSYVL